MGIIRWFKEKLMNWLIKDVILEELRTKKLIDKGNTLYVDIADFDHNASDGSPTESQMWYNSTDHVLRYRNDAETIDIGGGDEISYTIGDTTFHFNDDEMSNATVSWTLMISWIVGSQVDAQDMRTYFQIRTEDVGDEVQGRYYKNGGGFGTIRSSVSETYVGYTEDLTYTGGDLVQLRSKCVGSPYPRVYTRRWRLKGTIVPAVLYGFYELQ